MKDNQCSILHPEWGAFKDVTGCLKQHAHNDAHICKNNYGEFVEWEDDYGCNCGCWNDYDMSEGCKIWSIVSSEYVKGILNNQHHE